MTRLAGFGASVGHSRKGRSVLAPSSCSTDVTWVLSQRQGWRGELNERAGDEGCDAGAEAEHSARPPARAGSDRAGIQLWMNWIGVAAAAAVVVLLIVTSVASGRGDDLHGATPVGPDLAYVVRGMDPVHHSIFVDDTTNVFF